MKPCERSTFNNPLDGDKTSVEENHSVFSLTLPCHPRSLREVRRLTQEIGQKTALDMKDMFQLELVMDEACMNAVDHGSSINPEMKFQVCFRIEKTRIVILVRDFGGKPFNPEYFERLAEKKTWGSGGRGIHIIKQIMDEVMFFQRPGESTLLTMVKYLSHAKTTS
ncbi:MAG: hypothetical protein CVV64_05605 [Candidatus Wallbacteria bacterium HGW-Wallbacteria-1]|jgi:anti-sigma regulatory factor (Ser/Thr protein kinase)|uniref:Histidine kinase/HSP90-like ATPase domain-containing protein n=1 Tax=Candidatus Wallbacteria bacterium HGW-Wallbacteria-1 TaxID=2013854 RepID=A0A2N1PSD8_9BACT|nr:MAG: hypothetical protein CVV64_05605 [Candidatus Wallbacteria bacterium HGW-Wallbacteria-1]